MGRTCEYVTVNGERRMINSGASARLWAFFHHQFDLIRQSDGVAYLTRWWIVKTPWFGVALHRMKGADARTTLHDHPWPFVSIVLRGGYTQRRLKPRGMGVIERQHVRRINHLGLQDAHSIIELDRTPTWTLVFTGKQVRSWGFWEPSAASPGMVRNGDNDAETPQWVWTHASYFDSGHYVPLADGTRT